ncbi:MAG: DUF262 domain-containing protein [Alloprevotella sp.]|nr:DUF262 domain-containing protein [Alloprevotella sp.]
MKIVLHEIPIRDLVKDYLDLHEEGVTGYGGRLDIRPKYQREFIYNDSQRNEVIRTVSKGFPLNVMYWVKNGEDTYEVLDGQQRTISICEYCIGRFTVDGRGYFNLTDDEREKFLSYPLMVYFCEGKESEKLKWFETINIAGVELSPQELKNAVYSGPWVTDAKKYFSRAIGRGVRLSDRFVNVRVNRQELLELALKWISRGKITEYMAAHQHDADSRPLQEYFEKVLEWIEQVFPTYRHEMRGLPWGEYYNEFSDKKFDAEQNDLRVAELMQDEEVTRPSGIYAYLLTGNERYLSLRTFDRRDRRILYERQQGICPYCKKHFEIGDMAADHITPWSKGGKTVLENGQMLCTECNLKKSDK